MAKRTSRKPKRHSRKRTSRRPSPTVRRRKRTSRKRTSRRNQTYAVLIPVARNSRLSKKRRSKLPASKFVFPKDRAWPIESARGARDAIRYMKMGRVRSASDFMAIRSFIVKHYPAVWRRHGFTTSWPKTQAAKFKGMAHRKRRVSKRHLARHHTRRRPGYAGWSKAAN